MLYSRVLEIQAGACNVGVWFEDKTSTVICTVSTNVDKDTRQRHSTTSPQDDELASKRH
jgi:hypothetical protein